MFFFSLKMVENLANLQRETQNQFVTVLGMKSKLGENFLSLQCKDRAPYPLPPSIFTDGFSTAASYDRHGQETFHLNESKPTPYTHTRKWCGKIV